MKNPRAKIEPVSLQNILIEFLETMRDDLRRRSFDESGEQQEETLGRLEILRRLTKEIREGGEE